jgi:hypothetical protein
MAIDQYSKLQIEIDVKSDSLKFVGAEVTSLQTQLRFLRREMTLGKYTEQEFAIINRALVQTENELSNVRAKNRELFGSLALLPGPIGDFAQKTQMAINGLREFSKISMKDLLDDFKNLGVQLFGTGKLLENIEKTELPKSGKGSGNMTDPDVLLQATTATAALSAATDAHNLALQEFGKNIAGQAVTNLNNFGDMMAKVETVTDKTTGQLTSMNVVVQQMNKTTGELGDQFVVLSREQAINASQTATVEMEHQKLKDAFKTETAANVLNTDATDANTLAKKGNIIATEANVVAENALTKSFKLSTIASGLKTGALRILSGILIGLPSIIVAASAALLGFIAIPLADRFREWITGTREFYLENEALARSINANKIVLDKTLVDAKRRQAQENADLKAKYATDAELRKKDLKDQKENLKLANDAVSEAIANENKAAAQTRKQVGLFGMSSAEAETARKNFQDAVDQRIDMEAKRDEIIGQGNVKFYQDQEARRKKADTDNLRDLDAKIQREIESVRTESKTLIDLYTQRNNLVDKMNNNITLSETERLERKRIQTKAINEAIIEDNLRVLQSNADSIERQIEVVEKGSAEEYELRRKLAKANRDIALEEAKKDQKTRENNEKNANTKLAKDLIEIDKMYWREKMNLRQTELNSLYEGTVEFYDKERELEQESYRLKLIEAKNNAELIEALAKEHKRRLLEIDANELDAKADIEKRKAETAMVSLKTEEVGFLESFGVIKEANKKKFQDLADSENLEYEARKVRAAGNNEQLELINKEHVLRLGEIEVQRVMAAQETNQLIIDSTTQFGSAIGQIGQAIMEGAQGRNQQQFESAKGVAKAGVIIEKASAIGQIWSNNAVANAKAVAAFPLTAGQPWVTINTVTAGLSTVTTAAAAAKAIAEIDNRKFESRTGGATGSGRNYAMGGYIDGPRHSQGGVPLEAEGGEAIMTRGAVTAFAPLLSAINQMGGGTSFSQGAVGQSGYDFPTPPTQQFQQSQITKTYVVENELTTIQQRQARLKDLSTL